MTLLSRIGAWFESALDDLLALVMIAVFFLFCLMVVAGLIGNYLLK